MKQLLTFLLLLPIYVQAQILANQKFKFAVPVNRLTISDALFKESPSSNSQTLFYLPEGTSLKLIGLYDGSYRAQYKDYLGFVHFVFIDGDYDTFAAKRFLADGPRNFYDYENEPNDIVLFAKIEYKAPLRVDPSNNADTLLVIPEGAVMKVTHFKKDYWKTEVDGKVGYLAKNLVLRTAKTHQAAANPKPGDYAPRTTKELFAESDAIVRESNKILKEANRVSSTKSISYRTSSSKYYIRGPRGGCYYVTASGRKQYVDRSLCN